ncbi:hypothetical protein J6590_033542 [Homalodisca vitripennis]|nr:hypothetical protein J6590_033542 [Homalodisca vitripennis]
MENTAVRTWIIGDTIELSYFGSGGRPTGSPDSCFYFRLENTAVRTWIIGDTMELSYFGSGGCPTGSPDSCFTFAWRTSSAYVDHRRHNGTVILW